MTKEKETTPKIESLLPIKTKCFFGLLCQGFENKPCDERFEAVWARLSGVGILNMEIIEVWRPLKKTVCPNCGKQLVEFYDKVKNDPLLAEILQGDSALSLPRQKTPIVEKENIIEEGDNGDSKESD